MDNNNNNKTTTTTTTPTRTKRTKRTNYRASHNSVPISSVHMHGISARNSEVDVTTHRKEKI